MGDAEEEEARLDKLAEQLSKVDGQEEEAGWEQWPHGRRYLSYSSMFVFSPQNRWRLMVSDFVEHKHFTNFILVSGEACIHRVMDSTPALLEAKILLLAYQSMGPW
jgi:hypothetical protein